jgi:hypothetical protein
MKIDSEHRNNENITSKVLSAQRKSFGFTDWHREETHKLDTEARKMLNMVFFFLLGCYSL